MLALTLTYENEVFNSVSISKFKILNMFEYVRNTSIILKRECII